MAKRQSFANKANKVKHVKHCNVCGGTVTPTLIVRSVKSERGYRNKKHMVNICKCNHAEYYG